MSTKKVFAPIIALLTAAVASNPKVRVSDVLAEVEELTKANVGGGGGRATTFHKNDAGETDAIRCFYFQKWFDPRTVETGKKANTPSGYNSMCKVGLSQWTKQQRDYKNGKDELLAKVVSGEVAQADLGTHLQALEDAKNTVIAVPGGVQMFDTLEELQASQATA